jgi:hypothetical protein
MLEKLTGTCWNNRWNFTGNNTNQNLPIVVDPDLGEEGGEPVPCPVTQEEIDAFNKQLQEIGDRLVQASAGIIAAVIWQPYNPAFCRPVSAPELVSGCVTECLPCPVQCYAPSEWLCAVCGDRLLANLRGFACLLNA